MRKIIVPLVVVFFITLLSCGDDDDIVISIDPIVGKWNFTKHIENGEEQLLADCDQKNFLIFINSNVFEEFINEPATANECEASTALGTWMHIEEGMYRGAFNSDDNEINWELSEDGKTLINTAVDQNRERQFIYTKNIE